jgi:hypothetical protein
VTILTPCLLELAQTQAGNVMDWTQGEHPLSLTSRDSTRTELMAVLHSLVDMEGSLEGQTVLHRTDSQ